MTSYQNHPDVAAIVPAYNEEGRIGAVISILCKVKILDEIIIVDDGSSDDTASEALQAAHHDERLHVIQHPVKLGKGQALFKGSHAANATILVYLDADLINLTPGHVETLMDPVLTDQADMTIGVFRRGYWRADAAHWITPWLSGQRCLKAKFMKHVSQEAAQGYGVETAITIAARKNKWRCMKVPLIGVTHPLGEVSRGGYHGWGTKAVMFYQIGRAWSISRDRGNTVKRLLRQVRAE
ncbi:glycosyltransferase family 2 protein [Chloroflexota bacterium]